jgi:hypothetical protein
MGQNFYSRHKVKASLRALRQAQDKLREAIFARKQGLLRRLPFLAMTASPLLFLCSDRVLSHGPKRPVTYT